MPRRAGIDTIRNLFSILLILRGAREITLPDGTRARAMTVADLVTELGGQDNPPQRATVNGYLQDLESQNPHQVECIYQAPGRPKYWKLRDHSPLAAGGLADFDAWMLLIAAEHLAPLLPPTLGKHAERARDRAREVLAHSRRMGVLPHANPLDRLVPIRRVWVETPPPVDADVRQAVFDALRDRKRLRVAYRGVASRREGLPAQSSVVEPIRLVLHGDGRLYLLAVDVDPVSASVREATNRTDYRRLALHRISNAAVLAVDAPPRPGLEQLIDAQPGFGWLGRIDLEARVRDDLAQRLTECPINDSQQLAPEGDGHWHRLRVRTDRNWELRWWILSHGRDIVVLGPPDYRDEIAAHFIEGHAHYRESA